MKICVFCGSSMGNSKVFRNTAKDVANYFSQNGISLVYGGANVGLMKIIADTMLENNMEVIGVMPKSLIANEVEHLGISKMFVVESMAERKQKMLDLSDAFIALPGGLGTLDELSEILIYNQLRISDKPMGILNVDGYYDHLLNFLDHAVKVGYVREEHRNNLIVSNDIENLLLKMREYQPLCMKKWLEDIAHESNGGLK